MEQEKDLNQPQDVTEPVEFDPTTLSPEALAWVEKQKAIEADQRVTGAVKKTTARVRKETEEALREQIRKELESQAELSAEEKLALDRKALAEEMATLKRETNAFLVKKELVTHGFDDDAIDKLTTLVVTEDKEATISKLKELTDTFNSALTARVEKEKLSLLAGAATPPAGGTKDVSEKAEYLAKFEAAKKAGNEVAVTKLLRESQAKGIQLF